MLGSHSAGSAMSGMSPFQFDALQAGVVSTNVPTEIVAGSGCHDYDQLRAGFGDGGQVAFRFNAFGSGVVGGKGRAKMRLW